MKCPHCGSSHIRRSHMRFWEAAVKRFTTDQNPWMPMQRKSSSRVMARIPSRIDFTSSTGFSRTGFALRLWFEVAAVSGSAPTEVPVVDGSMLYYSGQNKGLFAVKIEPQGEGFAATPVWTNKQAGARFTTPVLKDGLLYGYHNGFFCASAQTGETLWTDTAKRGQSAAMLDAGHELPESGGWPPERSNGS